MSFIKSPRWSSRRVGALIEGKQQNGRLVVSPSPRTDGPGDIRQNKLLESLGRLRAENYSLGKQESRFEESSGGLNVRCRREIDECLVRQTIHAHMRTPNTYARHTRTSRCSLRASEMFLYCDYRHCHHHYSAGVCRRH